MDITPIINDYHASINAYNQTYEAWSNSVNDGDPFNFLLFGSITAVIAAIGLAKGAFDSVSGSRLYRWENFFFPVLIFTIVGAVLGGIASGMLYWAGSGEREDAVPNWQIVEDGRTVAAEALSEEIKNSYGIRVYPEKAKEALLASGDTVITFGAEHQGEMKTLGLQVNEDDRKLTIYHLDVELKPSKK